MKKALIYVAIGSAIAGGMTGTCGGVTRDFEPPKITYDKLNNKCTGRKSDRKRNRKNRWS